MSTESDSPESLLPLHLQCLNNIVETNWSYMPHILDVELKIKRGLRKMCRTPPALRPGGFQGAIRVGRSPLGMFAFPPCCSTTEDVNDSPSKSLRTKIDVRKIQDETTINTEIAIGNENEVETEPEKNLEIEPKIEENAATQSNQSQSNDINRESRIAKVTDESKPTSAGTGSESSGINANHTTTDAKSTAMEDLYLALQLAMLGPRSRKEGISADAAVVETMSSSSNSTRC